MARDDKNQYVLDLMEYESKVLPQIRKNAEAGVPVENMYGWSVMPEEFKARAQQDYREAVGGNDWEDLKSFISNIPETAKEVGKAALMTGVDYFFPPGITPEQKDRIMSMEQRGYTTLEDIGERGVADTAAYGYELATAPVDTLTNKPFPAVAALVGAAGPAAANKLVPKGSRFRPLVPDVVEPGVVKSATEKPPTEPPTLTIIEGENKPVPKPPRPIKRNTFDFIEEEEAKQLPPKPGAPANDNVEMRRLAAAALASKQLPAQTETGLQAASRRPPQPGFEEGRDVPRGPRRPETPEEEAARIKREEEISKIPDNDPRLENPPPNSNIPKEQWKYVPTWLRKEMLITGPEATINMPDTFVPTELELPGVAEANIRKRALYDVAGGMSFEEEPVMQAAGKGKKGGEGSSPGGGLPMRFEDTPYRRGLMERETARRERQIYSDELDAFPRGTDEKNPAYAKVLKKYTDADDAHYKLTQKYPVADDFEQERKRLAKIIQDIENDYEGYVNESGTQVPGKKTAKLKALQELDEQYRTATIDVKPEIQRKIDLVNDQLDLLDNYKDEDLAQYIDENKQNTRKFIETALKNPEILGDANPNSDLMFHYQKYLERRKTGKESVADFLEGLGKGVDAFLNAPAFGPEAAAFEGKPPKFLESIINRLRGKKSGGSGGEGGGGSLPPAGGGTPPQLPPASGGKQGSGKLLGEPKAAPKTSTPFINIDSDAAAVAELRKMFPSTKLAAKSAGKTPVIDVEGGISYEAGGNYRREGPSKPVTANEPIVKMNLSKIDPKLEAAVQKEEKITWKVRKILLENMAELERLQNTDAIYAPEYDTLVNKVQALTNVLKDQKMREMDLKIQHMYRVRPDWLSSSGRIDPDTGNMLPKVSITYEPLSNSLLIDDNTNIDPKNGYPKFNIGGGVDQKGGMSMAIYSKIVDPRTNAVIEKSNLFTGGELLTNLMYAFRDEVKSIADTYEKGNAYLWQQGYDRAIGKGLSPDEAVRQAALNTWSGKQHMSRGFDLESASEQSLPSMKALTMRRARWTTRPGSGSRRK